MRTVRGILVACLLLAVSACSNNKGKIVGKWESVSGSALAPGISVSLDFKADGNFTMTVQQMGASNTITGKYSLGMGDTVTLSNLSQAVSGRTTHQEKVTITGGQLTMTDSDGKYITFQKR